MIEIEKKFIVTDEQKEKLIEGAESLGETVFTDSYWDNDEYSLTTKDLWLRQRDGRFELKIPMNVDIEERVSDQYRELETDDEIIEYLELHKENSPEDSLKDSGYKPFITITTTRQKYRKDGFGLDFDSVDFGYNLMEIEYMTDDESHIEDDESHIEEATKKIIDYAKEYGLSEGVVRGKVAEYLRLNNPEHFQTLIDSKVIK